MVEDRKLDVSFRPDNRDVVQLIGYFHAIIQLHSTLDDATIFQTFHTFPNMHLHTHLDIDFQAERPDYMAAVTKALAYML